MRLHGAQKHMFLSTEKQVLWTLMDRRLLFRTFSHRFLQKHLVRLQTISLWLLRDALTLLQIIRRYTIYSVPMNFAKIFVLYNNFTDNANVCPLFLKNHN